MNANELYKIIVEEPIYLSIVLVFIMIVIYSVLKKFFKILLVSFICLLCYIGFLIYSEQDLPGDGDKIITPLIDNAGSIFDSISKKFKEYIYEKEG